MRFGEKERDRQKEARDNRLRRVLVSMRSMDSSRNFTTVPPPSRRGRPSSPDLDDYDNHPRQADYDSHQRHGQRQRPSDANTEEIIRFVRGYQLERETTFLRLQKKAVLPGIGQMSCSMEETSFPPQHTDRHDSRTDDDYDEENDDDNDDEEDEDEGMADEDLLLDSEVAAIDAAHRDPLRKSSSSTETRFDTDSRRRSQPRAKASASYGPPVSVPHPLHSFRPLDAHGHVVAKAHARRNLGRSLKQLPPIARDELPDRPSAPSPSLTPPGEDEELDSAGEPIDFIDAS